MNYDSFPNAASLCFNSSQEMDSVQLIRAFVGINCYQAIEQNGSPWMDWFLKGGAHNL